MTARPRFRSVGTVVLLWTICACATAQLITYDVNFEDVAEGESVDATLVTPTSGNSCSCNLTLASCDADCCCDPDCTDELKALFSTCSTEASDVPELTYCIATPELVEVRAPLFQVLRSPCIAANCAAPGERHVIHIVKDHMLSARSSIHGAAAHVCRQPRKGEILLQNCKFAMRLSGLNDISPCKTHARNVSDATMLPGCR